MSRGAQGEGGATPADEQASAPRLRRGERRDQILAAATRAFARAGYAATSLDDIAAEAAVTRAILYRHFASKADLYRAVLERAQHRLLAATGVPPFTEASIDGLIAVAADDPDGFRLLFQHAAREPEFRAEMDRLRADSITVALGQLAEVIPDRVWARWAAQLVYVVAIEAVTAWLDAGRPDRENAAGRIRHAIYAVIAAAGAGDPRSPQA
jgi:AcrR family transcriptional regulator